MKRIKNSEFFKLDIATTFLCLLPILFGLLVFGQLPKQIAGQFDAAGNPTCYVHREFVVFFAPVIMAAVNLLLCFLLELDVKKKNASRKLRIFSRFICPAVSIMTETIVLLSALKRPVDTQLVTNLFCGFIFLIVGNLLPKCKYNYTIGIRIVTTLGSEENWNKTHRLAGFVFVIGSIVIIAMTFMKIYEFTWVPFVAMVAIPILYSIVYAVTQRGQVKTK